MEMAEKAQALKADTVRKNYWRDNERFADFFNAVLFEGRAVIKPEELEDRDTEESPYWSTRSPQRAYRQPEIILK